MASLARTRQDARVSWDDRCVPHCPIADGRIARPWGAPGASVLPIYEVYNTHILNPGGGKPRRVLVLQHVEHRYHNGQLAATEIGVASQAQDSAVSSRHLTVGPSTYLQSCTTMKSQQCSKELSFSA